MREWHKHGLTNHLLYGVYTTMKQRCYNEKYKDFKNYGARGIGVCEVWKDNFLNFYNWAINNGWQKGLTLDRENNELGYSPDNCRYVTYAVNQRNKRRNINLTKDGATKCLQDWAEALGLSWMTLYCRIKRGIPINEALSSKKSKRGRKKKIAFS